VKIALFLRLLFPLPLLENARERRVARKTHEGPDSRIMARKRPERWSRWPRDPRESAGRQQPKTTRGPAAAQNNARADSSPSVSAG